jgi:hypothetical protein
MVGMSIPDSVADPHDGLPLILGAPHSMLAMVAAQAARNAAASHIQAGRLAPTPLAVTTDSAPDTRPGDLLP